MNKSDKSPRKLRSESKIAVEKFFRRFRRKYKTEDDCLETLLRWINLDQSQTCKDCGGHEIERKYGAREAKCIQCKKRIRITADSIFSHARTLRPWLAAILMMHENIAFNASDLSRGCNIVKSSGWTIVKKLSMVINEYIEGHSEASAVCSAAFSEVFTRRSLLTPANEHPRTEQLEFEQAADLDEGGSHTQADCDYKNGAESAKTGHANEAKRSDERVFSEHELNVLEILSQGPQPHEKMLSQMNIGPGELWTVLLILEIEQFIQSLPGGLFSLPSPNKLQKKSGSAFENDALISRIGDVSEKCVSNVMASIEHLRREFGGVSRKYLQLYLSAYWCLEDKIRWPATAVVQACNCSRPIAYKEVRAFVSPLFVVIAT